jgi:hypothetical protein
MIFQSNIQTTLLFILNPLAMIIFIVLGVIKVRDAVKKGGNPFNFMLALYFFFTVAGILVNIYYATVRDTLDLTTYQFLARLAAFLILYSAIFPTFFALAILKGFSGLSGKVKILYFAVWTILFAFILVIGNVDIIDYAVKYDTTLAIYSLFCVISIGIVFLMISLKNLTLFQDPLLKKKYKMFIVGYLIFISILMSTLFMLWGVSSRAFGAIYLAVMLIPAGYLIYYGIGKKLEE